MAEPTPAPGRPPSTSVSSSLSMSRLACSGAPAAERHHGVAGEVHAVLDGVDTGCVGHVLVDHLGHPDCGRVGVECQRRCDLVERPGSAVGRQRDVLGAERVRMGACRVARWRRSRWVRCRRGHMPPARARSPRCAVPRGSAREPSTLAIEPPACTDFKHLDHRDRDWHAAALFEAGGASAPRRSWPYAAPGP